jgi:hypothetical protein
MLAAGRCEDNSPYVCLGPLTVGNTGGLLKCFGSLAGWDYLEVIIGWKTGR